MRVLVKVGGAQLEAPDARAAFCTAVRGARDAGHEVILVHGGGNQIRAMTGAMGIEDRYVEGLRVTDPETATVVLAVLGGLVNRQLVAALQDAGVAAVGLTGADGGLFTAAVHSPNGADLGYVGEVARVDGRIVNAALEGGFTPVIATVAPLDAGEPGPRERFYNVNADQAAAPLARALEAEALLLLTDVPGVKGADGSVLPELNGEACAALVAEGVVAGGMVPKVRAALAAANGAPDARVIVAPANTPTCILDTLGGGVGTRFLPNPRS